MATMTPEQEKIKQKRVKTHRHKKSRLTSTTVNRITKMTTMYYVSVTGMELQSLWSIPKFAMFAKRSMVQAKTAPGIVQADGTYRSGIHHTLTVWEDKAMMLQYLRCGDHKEAMGIARDIGSFVKVYGYESHEIPSIDAALQLWDEKGRVVFKQRDSSSHSTKRSVQKRSTKSIFTPSTYTLGFSLLLAFIAYSKF